MKEQLIEELKKVIAEVEGDASYDWLSEEEVYFIEGLQKAIEIVKDMQEEPPPDLGVKEQLKRIGDILESRLGT